MAHTWLWQNLLGGEEPWCWCRWTRMILCPGSATWRRSLKQVAWWLKIGAMQRPLLQSQSFSKNFQMSSSCQGFCTGLKRSGCEYWPVFRKLAEVGQVLDLSTEVPLSCTGHPTEIEVSLESSYPAYMYFAFRFTFLLRFFSWKRIVGFAGI